LFNIIKRVAQLFSFDFKRNPLKIAGNKIEIIMFLKNYIDKIFDREKWKIHFPPDRVDIEREQKHLAHFSL
jgi:hypothetical protein